MGESPKKIWFRAKRYGYGWGLATCLQGWVVYIGYLVAVYSGIYVFHFTKKPLVFTAYFIVATVALLVIVYVKGEKAHWRWGGDSDQD